MTATMVSNLREEEILRYIVSDEELEAAAAETALSYTFQTSAYQRCCY